LEYAARRGFGTRQKYVFQIAQIPKLGFPTLAGKDCANVVRSGAVMDTNQRQIALSLLECLRDDLMYARLNNGSRVLDVADLRQYIYEQMGRIRTNALVMDGLNGKHNGHGQDLGQSDGHKASPSGQA
jgi:hypothetical protein